jgi:hypothetical protein
MGPKGFLFPKPLKISKVSSRTNLEKGRVTAAGPSPILTGFPIKLKTSIRTPVFIERKWNGSQGKNEIINLNFILRLVP